MCSAMLKLVLCCVLLRIDFGMQDLPKGDLESLYPLTRDFSIVDASSQQSNIAGFTHYTYGPTGKDPPTI